MKNLMHNFLICLVNFVYITTIKYRNLSQLHLQFSLPILSFLSVYKRTVTVLNTVRRAILNLNNTSELINL